MRLVLGHFAVSVSVERQTRSRSRLTDPTLVHRKTETKMFAVASICSFSHLCCWEIRFVFHGAVAVVTVRARMRMLHTGRCKTVIKRCVNIKI